MMNLKKIKSSLYSRYHAEARETCGEAHLRGLRRNVSTIVANRRRHHADFTGPGIKPQASRTDSVCLTAELNFDQKRDRNRNFKIVGRSFEPAVT